LIAVGLSSGGPRMSKGSYGLRDVSVVRFGRGMQACAFGRESVTRAIHFRC
jgi:hypothetical protein